MIPPRSPRFLGQTEMLEHVLMLFFIVILLIGLLIGLAAWQASQARLEQARQQNQRALAIATALFADYSRDSTFNDAFLTALATDQTCSQLTDRFGPFFAEFQLLPADGTLCIPALYPDCDTWQLCAPPTDAQQSTAYLLPITIDRSLAQVSRTSAIPQTALATLRIGVIT